MSQIKFTIGLLAVVGFLLQAFSFTVSYAPVSEFLGAYIFNTSLLVFFTLVILAIVEVSVYSFISMSLQNFQHAPAIRYVFVGLAIVFGVVSASLTTIGAGQVATTALVLEEEKPLPATAAQLTEQISTDNNRMAQIAGIQRTRTGGWLRDSEREELLLLQNRIEKSQNRLAEIERQTAAQNQLINTKNEEAIYAQDLLHSNFAFVTQIFLALTIGLRYYLKPYLSKAPKSGGGGDQQEGKHIQITPNRQQEIEFLINQGLSQNQVAKQLGINKSTVSRVVNS